MNGESHDLAPPAAGACGRDRAEIDTSATFESVREAVDRFGGSAAWSSHFIKHMFTPQNVTTRLAPPSLFSARRGLDLGPFPAASVMLCKWNELFLLCRVIVQEYTVSLYHIVLWKQDQCEEIEEECVNLEEQTAQLEKELNVKERETLDVLKELESTKKMIADLKLKIQKESADASTITEQLGQAEVPIAEPEERMHKKSQKRHGAP